MRIALSGLWRWREWRNILALRPTSSAGRSRAWGRRKSSAASSATSLVSSIESLSMAWHRQLPDRCRRILTDHRSVNAVGESWFATLKEELIHRQSWATIAQVRRAVSTFIEIFYNHQRLHSSLGYLTPVEFEQQIHQAPRRKAA